MSSESKGCGWTRKDCILGEDCPCFKEIGPVGYAQIRQLDDKISELKVELAEANSSPGLTALEQAINTKFDKLIKPLQDEVWLKGNEKLKPIVLSLERLQEDLLEALDAERG